MLLIGAKILEYRKAAHMSQEEFALKIGVSRQAVSKWELDKAYPDLDKLVDICKMFNISIDELLHTEKVPVSESPKIYDTAQEDDTNTKKQIEKKPDITSLGNRRGKSRTLCLSLCTVSAAMLFLFCSTVFITIISRNAANKDHAHIKSARIERVYQQYTKADVTFTADDSRKVLKTVWLDADGIRDGDYLECFTDDGQKELFIDYNMPTLAVPGILMLLFLCILILLCMEIRRVRKENLWYVLTDDETDKESRNCDE